MANGYIDLPSLLTTATTSTVTGDITLAYNTLYFVDTSAARTLTLPNPANFTAPIWIKDATGSAMTNNITVARFGGESIEGLAASYALQANWGSWVFVSNGTNWFLI